MLILPALHHGPDVTYGQVSSLQKLKEGVRIDDEVVNKFLEIQNAREGTRGRTAYLVSCLHNFFS